MLLLWSGPQSVPSSACGIRQSSNTGTSALMLVRLADQRTDCRVIWDTGISRFNSMWRTSDLWTRQPPYSSLAVLANQVKEMCCSSYFFHVWSWSFLGFFSRFVPYFHYLVIFPIIVWHLSILCLLYSVISILCNWPCVIFFLAISHLSQFFCVVLHFVYMSELW